MKCPKCNHEEWFLELPSEKEEALIICPMCHTYMNINGEEIDSQSAKVIEEKYFQYENEVEELIKLIKDSMKAKRITPVNKEKSTFEKCIAVLD